MKRIDLATAFMSIAVWPRAIPIAPLRRNSNVEKRFRASHRIHYGSGIAVAVDSARAVAASMKTDLYVVSALRRPGYGPAQSQTPAYGRE